MTEADNGAYINYDTRNSKMLAFQGKQAKRTTICHGD